MRPNQTLIAVLLSALLVAGCTNGKRSIKQVDADQNEHAEQTVTNTSGLSQRTLRLQEKTTLATALCTLQSNNHANPESRLIADVNGTKIYSQAIIMFDMAGCIKETLRWGGERLVMAALKSATQLFTIGIKGVAAVAIAKEVFDNRGVNLSNVGAGTTVSVGSEAPSLVDQRDLSDNRQGNSGDGSVYNTCAGEIVEGECVLPAESATPSTTASGETVDSSDGLFGPQPDGSFAGSGDSFCTPSEAFENGGDCPVE